MICPSAAWGPTRHATVNTTSASDSTEDDVSNWTIALRYLPCSLRLSASSFPFVCCLQERVSRGDRQGFFAAAAMVGSAPCI